MTLEQLLQDAQAEIIQLRERNKQQAARLEVFDTMKMFLVTQPGYGSSPGGMHPDVVRSIDEHLSVLKKKADSAQTLTDIKAPIPNR